MGIPQRVSVVVVAGAALLVTACSAGPCPGDCSCATDYDARYFLEIANDASDGVRVGITMAGGAQRFWFPSRPLGERWSSGSGIIALGSGKRRTFEISARLGTRPLPENNAYARYFSAIHFYDSDAETPYRNYVYPSVKCGEGDPDFCPRVDAAYSDDTFVYESSDGTTERLFVQSPNRPFYIERDKEDPDLARVVITFVPSADSGSTESAVGNRSIERR